MHRRRLLILTCAFATNPRLTLAQRTSAPSRVGLLWIDTGSESVLPQALRDGLRDLGYVDGTNVRVIGDYLVDRYDRLPAAARDLVRQDVDVIVTYGGTATLAARRATTTVPIVMVTSNDPVRLGVVASLSRPGGNVTGITFLGPELIGKRLQILRELVPKVRNIGILVNPASSSETADIARWRAAARALNVEVRRVEMATPDAINAVLANAVRQGIEALVVISSSFFVANRRRVAAGLLKYRMPALHGSDEETRAGGLVSYGPDVPDGFRRAAGFVDRILKGARPGDIPVEQPTKFELAINLKTANVLRLVVPQSLLMRADEVIQ